MLTSTAPSSTRPSEAPSDDPNSSTEEAMAVPPTGQSQQAEGSPSTASSTGQGREEQFSGIVEGLGPTTSREASPDAGTGGSEMGTSDQEGGEVMSDSWVTVAKLHLALEGLARPGGRGGAGRLDSSECAQFCAEWSRDCQLPNFFDRTLLEPAWSVAGQVIFRQQSYATRLWCKGRANTY